MKIEISRVDLTGKKFGESKFFIFPQCGIVHCVYHKILVSWTMIHGFIEKFP